MIHRQVPTPGRPSAGVIPSVALMLAAAGGEVLAPVGAAVQAPQVQVCDPMQGAAVKTSGSDCSLDRSACSGFDRGGGEGCLGGVRC
jgi:hypothetical protein